MALPPLILYSSQSEFLYSVIFVFNIKNLFLNIKNIFILIFFDKHIIYVSRSENIAALFAKLQLAVLYELMMRLMNIEPRSSYV